jgi:23S rRNA pseudouridine1911/1915/1917 synthase
VLRERFPDERLQVAHRLDRETSGLLLVARDFAAASALKKAFQRRQVQKRYLALVHGAIASDELLLDQPIGPAGGVVRVRMAVRSVDDGGLPARTAVTVLRRGAGYTLVECRPHTGRQHQIRVHLDAIGHPIVGDKLYPDESRFLRWAEGGDAAIAGELPLCRHALHAAGLRFAHPVTNQPVEVVSPLPQDLVAFLTAQNI